jgi:hypothetical protein
MESRSFAEEPPGKAVSPARGERRGQRALAAGETETDGRETVPRFPPHDNEGSREGQVIPFAGV